MLFPNAKESLYIHFKLLVIFSPTFSIFFNIHSLREVNRHLYLKFFQENPHLPSYAVYYFLCASILSLHCVPLTVSSLSNLLELISLMCWDDLHLLQKKTGCRSSYLQSQREYSYHRNQWTIRTKLRAPLPSQSQFLNTSAPLGRSVNLQNSF